MNAQVCLAARFGKADIARLDFWPGKTRRILSQWRMAFGIFCGVQEFYLWDLLPAVYLSYPELFSSEKVDVISTIKDLETGKLVLSDDFEAQTDQHAGPNHGYRALSNGIIRSLEGNQSEVKAMSKPSMAISILALILFSACSPAAGGSKNTPAVEVTAVIEHSPTGAAAPPGFEGKTWADIIAAGKPANGALLWGKQYPARGRPWRDHRNRIRALPGRVKSSPARSREPGDPPGEHSDCPTTGQRYEHHLGASAILQFHRHAHTPENCYRDRSG